MHREIPERQWKTRTKTIGPGEQENTEPNRTIAHRSKESTHKKALLADENENEKEIFDADGYWMKKAMCSI